MPSVDAFPSPGLQTVLMASSRGTATIDTTSFASGAQPITITPAVPSLATQVDDADAVVGDELADSALLSGGADPGGTLTFDLYGPDDDDCSGPALASSTHPVAGPGTYRSAPTAAPAPGAYRFVARYSGDADNAAVSGACSDPNETVAVVAAEPPGIRVVKTATPLSRPEPGGTFSFEVAITNTSAVPLTITGLVDDVHGDLAPQGTCTDAVGATLGPGDSYTCQFPAELLGNAGATQTDVVTVTAVDGDGTQVTDDDDAVVAITDVPPSVTVTKTALPEVRVAPGGLFTFGVAVASTSVEPVTITSLVDDVYGDLAQQTGSTCAQLVGRTLAPGEQVTCTFEGQLTGEAGAAQTDVVTVTVADDEGSTGTAQDDATIRLVAPDQVPSTTTTSPPTRGRPTPTASTAPSRLPSTGTGARRSGLLAGALLGVGLVLTGLGAVASSRSRAAP
jgi:hypothetical protein